MTARLHVDWTACRGRGTCTELLPELLEHDPWGYPCPGTAAATRSCPTTSRSMPAVPWTCALWLAPAPADPRTAHGRLTSLTGSP